VLSKKQDRRVECVTPGKYESIPDWRPQNALSTGLETAEYGTAKPIHFILFGSVYNKNDCLSRLDLVLNAPDLGGAF
jgi:hypothetical protein